MLTRKQKEELVSNVCETIKQSKSIVFLDFKGLSVTDTQKIKKDLRENGVQYKVLKKRLFDRAAKDAGLEVVTSDMAGQLAVAFSLEDEVSAAKILYDFSKNHETAEVRGGVLEGKQLTDVEVIALAKLPSKQELLAKMVGSLQSPISGFVQVISGNTRGLVVALKAIAEQKS